MLIGPNLPITAGRLTDGGSGKSRLGSTCRSLAGLCCRPGNFSGALPCPQTFSRWRKLPVAGNGRFVSGVLTRMENASYVAIIKRQLADEGFLQVGVEVPDVSPFIGAIGRTRVKFDASFTPAVEVAWRLHRSH